MDLYNINKVALSLVVASSIWILSGCGQHELKGEKVDMDSIVVDTVAAVSDAAEAPRCTIHVAFHYAKGANAQNINDSLLRAGILTPDYLALAKGHLDPKAAVKTFMRRYVEDYKRDGALILGQEPDYAELNWNYHVETKAERYGEGVIAYIATVTSYEGGADPTTVTIVRNIDAQTGHILALSDVLVPGGDKTVVTDIVEELCDRYHANTLDELKHQGVFKGIDPYLPDNFIFAENDIIFIYQPGEIADAEKGEIRVLTSIDKVRKKQN